MTCAKDGVNPTLAISIADTNNTERWVFIDFTPRIILFKVKKIFFDPQAEKIEPLRLDIY